MLPAIIGSIVAHVLPALIQEAVKAPAKDGKEAVAAVEKITGKAVERVVAELNDTPKLAPKPWWQSRTVIANIVGLALLALSLIGLDTVGIDQTALADALIQLGLAASFIASTVFRVIAKKAIR